VVEQQPGTQGIYRTLVAETSRTPRCASLRAGEVWFDRTLVRGACGPEVRPQSKRPDAHGTATARPEAWSRFEHAEYYVGMPPFDHTHQRLNHGRKDQPPRHSETHGSGGHARLVDEPELLKHEIHYRACEHSASSPCPHTRQPPPAVQYPTRTHRRHSGHGPA